MGAANNDDSMIFPDLNKYQAKKFKQPTKQTKKKDEDLMGEPSFEFSQTSNMKDSSISNIRGYNTNQSTSQKLYITHGGDDSSFLSSQKSLGFSKVPRLNLGFLAEQNQQNRNYYVHSKSKNKELDDFKQKLQRSYDNSPVRVNKKKQQELEERYDKVYIRKDFLPIEHHYMYKPEKDRGYGC